MIDYEEAQRILHRAIEPLGVVEVSLDEARGAVLAERVVADRDFPPTDRSAMDGYAVRAGDVGAAGDGLRVVGEARAGGGDGQAIGEGEALRIFTGGVVPEGADAVVMVEHTREDRDAGRVVIDQVPTAGQHIRRRGSELHVDQPVLEPGQPIHAPEIAALTSVGHVRPKIFRRPVVHVLSTGDELVEADEVPEPHQVRNSNAPTLLAQLAELGLEGRYLGIAPDSDAELATRLEQGLAGDAFLLTGGVSVGEYDLVAAGLERAGMELLFHKVRIKPGKPILAGRAGGCWVFGLPGNPVSAYTGFAVFVAPLLRRLQGAVRWENQDVRARLASPLAHRAGRRTYHLARLTVGAAGYEAEPVVSAGSGDVLSLARANGFVITPPDIAALPVGSDVEATLWRDFHLR